MKKYKREIISGIFVLISALIGIGGIYIDNNLKNTDDRIKLTSLRKSQEVCLDDYEPENYLKFCCKSDVDYFGFDDLVGDVDGDGIDDLVYAGLHSIYAYKGLDEKNLSCDRVGGKIRKDGVFTANFYKGFKPVLKDFNNDGILDLGYNGEKSKFYHAGNKELKFSNNQVRRNM